MIFALTNAVQERIKRDSSAASRRAWTVLGRDEATEAAFTLLLQQADALSSSPVQQLEDWLHTEEGREQALYDTRPDEKDPTIYPEADLFFVHIRKEAGRNILYFAHQASALTIGFQLGSHKLRNGRKALLEIFYAGMRGLGYAADDLEAYFTHSPLSSFTTTGDASSRSWMNSILSEYYFRSSQPAAGKQMLERDNFLYNENRTFLRRKKISWSRPPIDMFNEFFCEVTGIKPKRSIPAYRVQVRLLDEVEAEQAEYGGLLGTGQNRIYIEDLPWRRFLVPSLVNCADLSEVIMACFGLLNYHRTKYVLREEPASLNNELLIFELQDLEESMAMELSMREEQPEELMPGFFDQETSPIGMLYADRDMYQFWQYDFGDNFWFEIESIEAVRLDRFAVEYVDGGGDAPPTDVGGYGGFEEFKDALMAPSDGDNADHIRWAVEVVYWHPYDAGVIRHYLEKVNPIGRKGNDFFDGWARRRDTASILKKLKVPPLED